MSSLKIKRAPFTEADTRAWEQVYDDINDIINAVNNKSGTETRVGGAGSDGDIRLFKDVDKTKFFIEGKFADGWAKRELLFSDTSNESQDESINFNATESYVKPDGTVPFLAPITGVAPSNSLHLATKLYVDANATAFLLTGPVTGGTANATTVATTIATDAIAQSMMQNDSVGTNELLNSNVTYAKLQNISAQWNVVGRSTSNAGVAEELTPTDLAYALGQAQSANGADTYLAGTGVFREVTASTSMAGLNDTAMISLANDDIMVYNYISEGNAGNLWKNRTLATAVRPHVSASSPLAYNSSTGVFTHETGAGKNHVPTGGSSGQFLKYSSSGVAVWTTPSYTTSLAHSAITSVGASDHHTRYDDIEALAAINDTTSISTTCDSPDVNHHVKADWTQGTSSHAAYIQNKPNIHYTSAVSQSELRTTLGYGNQGLVPAVGNSGEFLSYNGTFDEISVSVSVAGLSDTALISLGARHFLYYDGATYWKNTLLLAGDIPNLNTSKLTAGTLPVARGGTGVTSGYNNSNWDTAYTDRLKWDGGSTGLTASTARTSLALNTTNDVRFDSFGVGTNASGVTGEIRATNEVTAYYSDDRLKDRGQNIYNALKRLCSLNGFYYKPNKLAGSLGYDRSQTKVGVSAQEVLKVLPQAVTAAPIDPKYHAVQYDKLIPLMIEAIKELNAKEKTCCCGSK